MNGMCRPLFKVPLELRTLVERSCNETLTEQECERLNELLRGDAEAQSFYLAYLSVHARLSWELGPRPSVEATSETLAPAEPVASVATRRPPRRRRRSWAIVGGVVAAAAVAVCVFFVDWTPEVAEVPAPPVENVGENVVEPPIIAEEPVHLAVLSGSDQRPGALTDRSLEVGQPLPDNRLTLPAGVGEVTFAGGVIVLVEGPGELEILDSSRAFLHLGKAVVRIPPGAEGFILETASVDVHDLGTEFAIKVEPSGATEVQVLDGAVIAHIKDADNKAFVERSLEVGQAIAVTVAPDMELEPAVHEIAFAPERFVRRLPELEHVAIAREPLPDVAAPAAELDGPVLRLSFDRDTITKDGDTLTFKDLSGNGNDGRSVGAVWTDAGIGGGACKLDGVDDYIACEDAPSLNIKGPMTISMWVKLEAWDNEGGLCTKGTGDGGESWLIDMRGKRMRFVRRPTSGTPYKEVLADESIEPGKWYHVVAVADGQRLRLYLNMAESITEDYTQESLLNDHTVTIGSRQSHDGPYDASIAGVVDEVVVWPRALTPAEIELLYRRGQDALK